ncbi:MAG: hypothetical protein J5647_08145 [Spirochaetaceae bacterium]|nr:hypothetical protein [Spirochaetaceae bacterium]
MRKISVLIFVIALNFTLFADRTVGAGNSYSEFPFIILVGQLVDVTPFSVVFENTLYETNTTTEKIGQMIKIFDSDTDFRSHGMANALRAASVKNGKMRLSFYLDNITKIFSDDASTYVRYLPLFYLFENNIKEMMLTQEQIDEIKKLSAQYFLDLPMTKELIKNSWLAGVFQINPSNDKLIYKSARFFKNFEELETSDWARNYRIPEIVRKGMTVSMTKAIYIGHESENANSKGKEKGKKSGQNKKQFDNRSGAPVGREK